MTARRVLLLLLVAAAACGGEPPADDAEEPVLDEDSIEALAALPPQLPEMPAYPEGRPGRLTVVSAGALTLDHSWQAEARVCDDPPVLALLVQDAEAGVSIRLDLAGGDSATGPYVVQADSASPDDPAPPAAQVGAQRFDVAVLEAYRASEGTVELLALGAGRVSGRLAVTLRSTSNARQAARLAGTFRELLVRPQPPAWCAELRGEPDSATADAVGAPADDR